MASFNHYQPIAIQVWTISHNLNTKLIAMDTMKLAGGGVYEKVLPTSVEIIDNNNLSVNFSIPVSGRARIVAPNN